MAVDVTEVALPANLSDYAVVAENLTKSYGTVVAVRGLNLRVARASIFALLGPNGAGKTTTFNMLTTLSRPDSGFARVAGFDVVKEADEVRRRIGVTFQEQLVDKQLSGRKLLDIHGKLYGFSPREIKAKIDELAKLVELEEWLDTPVRNYSGGMRRRLELARGLLTEPEVLFLDEPTTGLDPQNRTAMWEYLQDLRDKIGLTVIFSTHYIEEAERAADRVAIIDGGQIVAEDAPEVLVREIGPEVLWLEGAGDFERFIAALQEQNWVSAVSHEKLAAKSSKSKRRSGISSASSDNVVTEPEVVVLVCAKENTAQWLKPAVDLAAQTDFKVTNVSINLPDLNDVFLKYTGKRIRD